MKKILIVGLFIIVGVVCLICFAIPGIAKNAYKSFVVTIIWNNMLKRRAVITHVDKVAL